MSKQLKEIQEKLRSAAEKRNIDFFQKMVPGEQKIYGVKIPVLYELAKKYVSGEILGRPVPIFPVKIYWNSKEQKYEKIPLVPWACKSSCRSF